VKMLVMSIKQNNYIWVKNEFSFCFSSLIIFWYYLDVCQEKNSIEDTLKSKFDYELKLKLDDLHQILEKEYNEKILLYNHNQEKFEQDKQIIIRKYNQNFEQQSKEFHQEIDRIKVNYEKQIIELNNELDQLRIDGKFYVLINNWILFSDIWFLI